MALTKLSTDSIDLSGNTTALTIPSGTTSLNVDFLVVAGGGSGATFHGGGGGAGGYRTSYGTVSPITLSGGSMESPVALSINVAYTVTVGAGAAGVSSGGTNLSGNNGSDSTFSGSFTGSPITSTGGGAGSSYNTQTTPGTGGSGGGGGANNQTGAAAVSSPVVQGFAGGDGGQNSNPFPPGGGGGAGSVGANGTSGGGGNGGDGLENQITGATGVFYAGGGGGGTYLSGSPGTGGSGVGGNGGPAPLNTSGFDGAINTGSGGGGANADSSNATVTGAGGSGVIILRYSSGLTATYSAGAGGAADAEVTIGSDKYIKITAGTGTVTFTGTGTGRPSSPTEGLLRDNTTTGALEFYDGSLWQQIAGTLVPENAPSSNFNTVLYTGNGSTQPITGVGFKPDFVWLKNLASQNHYLMDSVRGPTCGLFSALTDAEFCSSNYLTSFDSDGFTTGSTNNISSNTYVSWNWKAGGNSNTYNIDGTGYGTASAASLDGGTITPTGASINTATGFSIVKYTGNDTQDATYNTGLTVTSDFVITKSTSTMSWYIWSSALPSATNYLKFDTSGQNTTYTPLYPTNPVSGGAGVFKIGSDQGVNESTKSYIAYHFANINKYQKIGTYDGNGLSTGNMVTTGFEPAWLMVKEISTSGGYWYIVDNKRNTSNPRSLNLFPNDIGAEASYGSFDFLPTGFQPVNNWGDTNGSGQTYIYLAISS